MTTNPRNTKDVVDEAREVAVVLTREVAETLAYQLGGAAANGVDHGQAAYNEGVEAFRAALTQQEEKPRCARCKGRGRVPRSGIDFGNPNVKMAARWNDDAYTEPCPDCSPAEKPDEDWPRAILTLRRAMCCRAGREQVERELIRPFGYVALSQAVWGELDRKWSRPVEIALKDGKLLIREPSPAPTTGDTE